MKSVVEHLQNASRRLKRERPGMSLRAVAGRLDISPSYWSKILRGERALSKALLPRVVKVLAMDVQQVAELQRCILQNIENEKLAPATGLNTQTEQRSPVADYKEMGTPDFWMLEEWFHIPILNALTLSAQPTIDEIARRLKIGVGSVNLSVAKAIAAGFLIRTAGGQLKRTDLQVRFPTSRSHPAVRKFQGAMIGKALEAITAGKAADHFEERLISSVCFAGSKEKILAARLILEEAMYRAANLMAGEDQRETVYQLNVQLFPHDRKD